MSAIGKAIGPLVNIALLLLFAIIIFAIIGLEFYAGALNSTCYSLEDLGENFILYNCRNCRGFSTAGHFDRYGFESQRNSVLPGNIINCDIARALFHNHINRTMPNHRLSGVPTTFRLVPTSRQVNVIELP